MYRVSASRGEMAAKKYLLLSNIPAGERQYMIAF